MKGTEGENGRKQDKQRRQRDLLDKGKHDGSDSQSSDPPQQPFGNLATDDDLQSFTDMSNADLEELIRTSPHKNDIPRELDEREPKKRRYVISSNRAAAPKLTHTGARHKKAIL